MDEGNEVRFAMSEEADETYRKIGEGLATKSTLEASAKWAQVIIFDSNIFELPAEAEKLRGLGKPVIGSSALSGELENDRAFAVQFAKKSGLQVPDYEEFVGKDAWKVAERYLLNCEPTSCWVWKPNGEAPASTYVAESLEEMLAMFRYWEKLFEEHGEEPNFILTEKIDGEEISTEGWFNGEDFYFPNHTLERTRFFDGDHGEKTGCAGNVVWGSHTLLHERLIEPLKGFLRGKYNGPVDVNAIVEKESNAPIFLEFTPRFGYDAIFGLMEILQSDLGELFYKMSVGEPWTGSIRSDYSGIVRLHIPPYPEPPSEEDKQRPVGLPIYGWLVEDKVGPFYPVEVMDEQDRVVTSGPDGYVALVGGFGATPKQAMERAYKEADKVRIPLVRYRLDLADKLEEVWGHLKSTGWLKESKRGK
jgi:phosphoribosylamine-glycine ligase